MCRSIKVLRKPGQSASTDELAGAALQFVRKISGFRKPSAKNQEAFEAAVQDITAITRRLLAEIGAETLPAGTFELRAPQRSSAVASNVR